MEVEYRKLTGLVVDRLGEYRAIGGNIDTLASMTGSTRTTVQRWSHKHPPNGERLIKLWHILAAFGIKSPELRQINAFSRYCGELLAYGLVDMNELLQICGQNHPQKALRVLRGYVPSKTGLSVKELHQLYDTKLQEKKELVPLRSAMVEAPVRSAPAAALPVQSDLQMSDRLVIAAASFGSTLAFARYFNSDDSSPEERSKLRALLGDGGMFELSNHLNALCSERSRNQER